MVENRKKSEETGLTPVQERALLSLLTCRTQEAAARQAGITARSLRKYLHLPNFKNEYLARRRELMSSTIVLAQRHVCDMVQVQINIAIDPNSPASVRVSAASAVFGIADDGLRTEDLLSRIEALEVILDESRNKAHQNGAKVRGGAYK